MSVTPKNYDFRDVVVTYAGPKIEGFAEQGDAVSIEPAAESIRSVQGADGELAIIKGPAKPVRVTLRLMHTSASVTHLSTHANLQANARGPYLYPALLITDLNTGSIYTLPQAWVVQQPSASYGSEIGVREFVLEGLAEIQMKGAL